MSNSWDKAINLAEKHSANTSVFVKLANDGDKVVGIFVGEPHAREVHWTGARYDECTVDKRCAHCAEGKRPSLRASMNFYVLADKAMKVIEGGTTWFKDLCKCRDKYGLDRWSFEVERHGDAGDTKTSYTILPDEQLTEEQRAGLGALQLHDLKKVMSSGSEGGGGGDFNSYDKAGGDGLMEARSASELVGRLKTLPREAVDGFLKKFGVKRVRDLKATDEAAARKYIEGLEGKTKSGDRASGSTEIDPFA